MHPQPIRQTSAQPISERRLDANRANAQKSTGPRTEEGKARSSHNAFRHGITGQISVKTEEDRAAYNELTGAIAADLQPEGALEQQIASSIADGHWRLNRIRACEDNIFALGHYTPAADLDVDNAELHAALTSAQVFLDRSKDLERLTLYEQRIQRGIERHMRELEALQAKRKAAREQALAEAATLLQIAEFNGEDPAAGGPAADKAPENGFEFSTRELRCWIHRKESLKRAAYHEKHFWNPEIEYPGAA